MITGLGNISRLVLLSLLFWLAGCSQTFAASTNDDSSNAPIYLIVSLHWEGDHILPHNIAALREFREKFAGIALLQFLNPAYYTKPNADRSTITTKIKATMMPQDDIGLSLHGWKSLVQDAGLVFRSSPTFWGNKLTPESCKLDCGHEVPISVYREDELVQLIRHAKKVLVDNGFEAPTSFSAGGWLASQAVLEAVAANAIVFDFSSAALPNLRSRLRGYPIYSWLEELWSDITPLSQPFTKKTRTQDITEIGNSGARAGYLSAEEMVGLFKDMIAQHKNKPRRALTFHLGFYQETARTQMPVIESALKQIFALSEKEGINLRPITLPGQTHKLALELRDEFLAH